MNATYTGLGAIPMSNVVIAGGFDPIHAGHIDHIQKAAKLGYLTVILATDEQLIRKKGYALLPYRDREAVLNAICGVMGVIPSIDKDNTVAETLRTLKPDIFAKGGDRTPDNMPQSEIDICAEIGCRIIYGCGDLLNSSTNLVKRVVSNEKKGENYINE